MRPWIEYLITNASAGEDFVKWTQEIENQLHTRIANAVRANEIEEARALAHELTVYDTIRSKVQTEMRERISQIKHESERS